jgi:hypothetical protein
MLIYLLLIVTIVLLYKNINIIEPFESKNKCAFCVPLHPKHYDYGYKILKQLQNKDADLYFIFTTQKDKNDFEMNIQNNYKYNYLILTDFTELEKLNDNNSWVSVKKIYALSELHTKYDYISCIDSEVMFINTTNFYNVMKNITNNKKIIGGNVSNSKNKDYIKIIKNSLTNIVPYEDVDKLKQISNDYTIYTWWSNLPVYDCKKAKEFLQWINFNNTYFLDKINWYVFDDLLYNYFLILKYDFELIIIPELNSSLEYANNNIIQKIDKTICKLYWVNYSVYKKDIEYYKNNDFILVYHLDRTKL